MSVRSARMAVKSSLTVNLFFYRNLNAYGHLNCLHMCFICVLTSLTSRMSVVLRIWPAVLVDAAAESSLHPILSLKPKYPCFSFTQLLQLYCDTSQYYNWPSDNLVWQPSSLFSKINRNACICSRISFPWRRSGTEHWSRIWLLTSRPPGASESVPRDVLPLLLAASLIFYWSTAEPNPV